MIEIDVQSRSSQIVINGLAIASAPTVFECYFVIGRPDRIDSGTTPAPVGHRNNQLHVYDRCGMVLYEHHYTRRASGLTLWVDTAEPLYRFTPRNPFAGKLVFDSTPIPIDINLKLLAAASPWQFESAGLGDWKYQFGGFTVFLSMHRVRLPSGRKSRTSHLQSIHLSWPHDPYGLPAND